MMMLLMIDVVGVASFVDIDAFVAISAVQKM
jgi:hypothetical protein